MGSPSDPNDQLLKDLAEINARLNRIEDHLGLNPIAAEEISQPGSLSPETRKVSDGDALEYEIGQFWFAKAGIIILAVGVAFLLTFPYENLNPVLPSLLGYAIAGVIIALSRIWKTSFAYLSPYLLGGGLVLLYFSTLRLHFFSPVAVNEDMTLEYVLLAGVAIGSAVIVARHDSVFLMGLALTMGYATALIGVAWPFALGAIVLSSAAAVYFQVTRTWPWLSFYAAGVACLVHLVWSVNNPFLGNPLGFLQEPRTGLYIILLYAGIFAGGMLLRNNRERETASTILNSFFTSGGTYAIYLLLSILPHKEILGQSQLLASVVYLGISIAFWLRERSRYSTFFYAMLGYVALSVAIVGEFPIDEALVWLSWQSLLVISTALWFRSKYIVVANSIIYLLALLGYLVSGTEVQALGLSFGVVALVSARIMNVQQHRLELRTEVLRNLYLGAAFFVFPYVLYHLVPSRYVSLSWLGVAVVYFALNLLLRNQKYRWMGIWTLLLTIGYVLVVGIIALEPTYRILSLLALGVVLLVVSMIYARSRARKGKSEKEGEGI